MGGLHGSCATWEVITLPSCTEIYLPPACPYLHVDFLTAAGNRGNQHEQPGVN